MPPRRTVSNSYGASAARALAANARTGRTATTARRMRMAAGAHATPLCGAPQPGRSAADRALRPRALADALDDLVEVVVHREAIQVLRRDHPARQRLLSQPADQAAPVARVDQADGELVHLAVLDQRERLEELVQRAEAAGQDHERVRVADEHDLAREEVVELQRGVDVAVDVLLEGQLDVQPDRARADLMGAAVGRLHRARAAAGDHGEAGAAQPPADLPGQLVLGASGRRARRAEHRHAALDPVQRLEAHLDLAAHPGDALVVGDEAQDARQLGAEDLLVVGERPVGGLARHRSVTRALVSGGLRARTFSGPRRARNTARPRLSVSVSAPASRTVAALTGWSRPPKRSVTVVRMRPPATRAARRRSLASARRTNDTTVNCRLPKVGGRPFGSNGWTCHCSSPPNAATWSSPSDSPAHGWEISRRRAPVVVSIDHTSKRPVFCPATSSRPSTKVAPVMPDGGTAFARRRTGWMTAWPALAGLMSAVE